MRIEEVSEIKVRGGSTEKRVIVLLRVRTRNLTLFNHPPFGVSASRCIVGVKVSRRFDDLQDHNPSHTPRLPVSLLLWG